MVVTKRFKVNALSFVNPVQDLIQLSLVAEGSPWGADVVLTSKELQELGITIGGFVKLTVTKD